MSDAAGRHVIGLISDTHGQVRAEVHQALAGVELILHAGDVGGHDVLRELELVAPVRAVFGNTDVPGDPELPAAIDVEMGGVRIHVSHGHELGVPTPDKLLARYDADVIVFGHTHRPVVVHADDRWVVNPGSAGPRRFFVLTPTVARMTIDAGQVVIDLVGMHAET